MTLRAVDWNVRLLGRFEVVSATGEIVKLPSRAAASLLAYLSLNKTKETPNDRLHHLCWPDGDGDRQAQNLRRAICDLRDVLERDVSRGSVIVTRRGYVSLNPDKVATDVEIFLELAKSGPSSERHERLAEAVSLYAGPLLAPLNDYWITSSRMELEESYAQSVDWLCNSYIQRGGLREAIRIGRAAVLAAPLREDIHIVLISAYRSAGLESEAIRQFELLEKMLDENWGEPPSALAVAALEGSTQPEPSSRTTLISEGSASSGRHISGGALPIGSKSYVRRAADAEAESLVAQREGVILIHGPRQVGKSSLLARTLAFARSQGVAVVLSDAQAMGESDLESGERLYQSLGHEFAVQLDQDLAPQTAWGNVIGPNASFSALIGRLVGRSEKHVCWAIDEADLLFDRPYTNDFFGLLRSWHNRRALDPDGPWTKLTLVLTYATEANLFITDLNQSPFNVGVRLNLQDFNLHEVEELQTRFAELGDAELTPKVFSLTHGHPHLSQCAFTFLSNGGTVDQLVAKASDESGPFGTHLKHMLVSISQSDDTVAEVKRLLRGEPFAHPTTRYRLQSAGLIVPSTDGTPVFRVPVYETYLRGALG